MLYHSKKPTVHYLLPEDYLFPKGDFEIYSTKSKKVLVNKKDVLRYKIDNAEAMKLLTSELNTQLGDFMKGIKNITSKVSDKKKDDTNNDTTNESSGDKTFFSEKLNDSLEFLGLSTKVMGVFWKIAKTDNQAELLALRNEMLDLKKTFQEKGYEPNHDFEDVPFKLKAKYENDDRLTEFREGAKEFEQIISQFKKKKPTTES